MMVAFWNRIERISNAKVRLRLRDNSAPIQSGGIDPIQRPSKSKKIEKNTQVWMRAISALSLNDPVCLWQKCLGRMPISAFVRFDRTV